MQNTGRLTTQAQIKILDDEAGREEKALNAVRDEAREWAFKSLVGLRVEVAEFEVE
jgi:hypothetical protein